MTDVAIVGAGLTGLSLAHWLIQAGLSVQLIEARARVGGRIKSIDGLDLGPTWYWPGHHRMEQLVQDLALQKFEQYASGDMVFERPDGTLQRGRGMASMAGSFRISGGMAQISDGLLAKIGSANVRFETPVRRVTNTSDGVTIRTKNGLTLTAKRVVIALPPRCAAQLTFETPLPDATMQALHSIPTWMGGQAKAVATYENPHWRSAGLSGDAISQRGPMVEMHDASADTSAPYALFGFIGVPPSVRHNIDALESAVRSQFTALFSEDGTPPGTVHIKDWAFDPFTATKADHAPMTHHPAYGRPSTLGPQWSGKLHFAASELGSEEGGFLEGALSCAEDIAKELI